MKTAFACVALIVVFYNISESDAVCDKAKLPACVRTVQTCAAATLAKTCATEAGCYDDNFQSVIDDTLAAAGVDCSGKVSVSGTGCDPTKAAKCTFTEFTCSAYTTYIKCLTDVKCVTEATKSAAEKNLEKAGIKCAGVPITVSVSLMIISVMAAIKNYF